MSKRWVKFYTTEWLEGSIRVDLNPSERGVWADLLTMGGLSRREGHIERSVGIPYTDEQLAAKFVVDLPILQSCIAKCVNEGRLRKEKDGSLVIVNWDKYQSAGEKKKRSLTEEQKDVIEFNAMMRYLDKYPEAAKCLNNPEKLMDFHNRRE